MSTLKGTNGDDLLQGTADDDKLIGGAGDDILEGGEGDDRLVGGAGDDVLIGDEGDDKLTGGSGDDLFDFTAGFGSDEITDFKAGEDSIDRILLRDTEATSFAEVLALAANVGEHVVVSFLNGDTLTLKGLSIADLHEDDFIFETSVAPLFDNTANTVDFNVVTAGTYVDGTQYNALDGDDVVTLANTAAAAVAAGYVIGTAFDAGAGNDTVIGGSLDDNINGDAGNDFIDGMTGLDTISAGVGDDRVKIDDLDLGDNVDGGDDTDTFVHTLSDGINNVAALTASSVILNTVTYAISNFENFEITGGDGNDIINENTGGNSILRGGDGNDSLSGTTGVDQLFGDDGNDLLDFWDANTGDYADGGAGSDTVIFREVLTSNNNVITIANGNASISADGAAILLTDIERVNIQGGGGNDDITGGDQADSLNGNAGNDTVRGGSGNDQVLGSFGIDTLFGDDGDDSLSMYDANVGDSADGGAGFDTFIFRELPSTSNNNVITVANGNANVTVDGNAIALSNIEQAFIASGNGNDDITGGDQDDRLQGEAGNDTIRGGDGADRIDGGTGIDMLFGDAGDDVLTMFDANVGDSADGGAGTDRFQYADASSSNNNIITVGSGNASVTVDGVTIVLTSIENVTITAGGGDDDVTGGDQNDLIRGLGGNDTIRSGAGNDQLTGDAGDDLFIFNVGDGSDIIGDFTAGVGTDDVIDVSSFGFDSFNGAGVRLIDFATDNGVNTTIDLDQLPGGDQLRLDGVLVADLDSSDFII